VRKQEFDEAVDLGRANEEAIELMRRHCRHGRIEAVGGNSFVGSMVGLPMGPLEVRCEYAPPPHVEGHQALELAIEFYEANCVGCPHRDPTGELPSLATVAGQRAADEVARKAAAKQAADERARRYRQRCERRHQLLAGEGHVVRDLADAMDRIDRAEPRTGPPTPEEDRAARQVLDAARGAPELFRPILVDSLLELATDTTDMTAFEALRGLVRSGRCPPRRAFEAARAVLQRCRSVDAGRLLALVEPDLRPGDLPDLLDQLIALASGEDRDLRPVPWRLPSSPEGLIAASHVDLPAVTGRIIEHLASGDELTREAGADAARVLLALDATRVVALGQPLAASVRGPDTGYAGYPHPAAAALRALAEAWRGEPEMTRRIVEAEAAGASDETRSELSRLPWFVQRFREPWDASATATSEAISFVVQRAGGDWGEEAANHAANHLTGLTREIPEAVAAHANALLGAILALCTPEQDSPAAVTETGTPALMAALERQSQRISRKARLRRLAETMGRCATVNAAAALPSVQGLFSATTGNEDHDRAVRVTMLKVLEKAVSPETLRDILPVTYTALLDTDQTVRSGGIGLWAACAAVADSLPTELTELSVPLLNDEYVIVHRTMLDQIPHLSLPADVAPKLLPIVFGWVVTYASKPDPDILDLAIWALRSLASDLAEPSQVTGWFGAALAYVGQCRPYDRERLLTAWWPDDLRDHRAWTRAALATAADPDLADYYNQRHEPLLQAFMDRPQLLAEVPLAEIEPLSSVHGTAFPWRALEPVELMQSAGRWADAAIVARSVETGQPPGEEGAPGRRLAGAIARGAELAEALAEGPPAAGDLTARTDAVTSAVAELEASFAEGVRDGQPRFTLDGLLASATVPALLLASPVSDPASVADELDRAAGLLLAAPSAHASGTQRVWIARAWQIAAVLFRYDAAVQAISEDAAALLHAAKRRAEVLHTEVTSTVGAMVPADLINFLTAVEDGTDLSAAQVAWQGLAGIPPPVSLVGTSLLPQRFGPGSPEPMPQEPPRAVCVATMHGVPVTDILVVRPKELYHLGMTVRLVAVPDWAERCIVEPVTTLGRDALALPRHEFSLSDGVTDEFGITLTAEGPLHCTVDQPVRGPALDCPIQVRLAGNGHEQVIEVAGCQRLRLRPFDPSRDTLTEHEQTDARLLAMFGALDAPEFDTEDTRAFCRLFAACVRAAQVIMFNKTFMRGSRVSEAEFHDELERRLRADPELEGRLTRRDAVAGGFDDLLHDDVIAELKVSRGAPVTVDRCTRYLGQPAQYGVGRGSQLSVLVVFDHGRKEAPPGVIDNYMDWLRPRLHGLEDDPRYPSLVGVLIVNSNLPIPSAWSRRRIEVEPVAGSDNPQS
jgi:hypothetical protein